MSSSQNRLPSIPQHFYFLPFSLQISTLHCTQFLLFQRALDFASICDYYNRRIPSTSLNSQTDIDADTHLQNIPEDLSISSGTGRSVFSHSEVSVLKVAIERLKKYNEDLATLLNDYEFGLQNAKEDLLKKI